MIEIIISIIALLLSGLSLFITYTFNKQSKEINEFMLRLTKQQKQMALLSILSPACDDSEAWKMFIAYLNKNNTLPDFEEEDYQFLSNLFNRMSMKINISKGKMEID